MSKREQQTQTFLTAHGWGEAKRVPVPGDASSRRYERLDRNGEKAVLMDTPMAVQPKTDYMKIAKIAGNDVNAFICISKVLTRRGFSAPKIFVADMNVGLVLLEDLGDDLFSTVLRKAPEKEQELYSKAVEVLAAIYRSTILPDQSVMGVSWHIGDYDEAALMTEADLFLDWYIPEFESKIDDKAREDWHTAWRTVLGGLSHIPPGLALRDFHADNIFWLPDRIGPAKIGLIDFQDGLFVHPAYDLVSLIEDARRDVNPALAEPLKSQFCAASGMPYDDAFKSAYAVLAAQRNAKILGIFVRLSARDGKHHYRDFLPRVRAHFLNDIRTPGLDPIREWVERYAKNLSRAL